MNDPGFMDGYTNDLPLPLGWVKGQTSIDMPVICCPECASIQVAQRDNAKNDTLAWWECSMCRHRWRLPRTTPLKGYIHG